MRFFLSTILVLFISLSLSAQESRLAQQYYQNGEYQKAAVLFEKLYGQNERNDYYFDRYVDCLIALERYDEAEKAIKKQLRRTPDNTKLYVTYGNLLEQQIRDEEAQEQYRKAIKNLEPDRFAVTKLANAFIGLTKYELAIETYEKGSKLLRDDNIFSYNLGDLYRRKGDMPNMIVHYLNSLDANPNRMNTIQTLFQRYLPKEDYAELQKQLYTRIQDDRNAMHYPELLTWVFIQSKDYPSAFRQVKAMDRRMKENGGRVYNLAQIAANDGDYDTAIDAYDYIVENKGITSSFYIDAKKQSLRVKRNKLVEGFQYTEAELKELEAEYESFLNDFRRDKSTASIILELAELEAFYLNDLDKAIALLSELIEYPGINPYIQANSKLRLADFYLMQGERWEATLLYSQVDKAFKDDLLGHEARFRNAKLSYYAGDFQWAQAQFDVLKASTSKLIANDALDLSVFIMDNLGLDTTALPLEMYAAADLLVFQNRFEDAFQKLDSLNMLFPDHGLEDDIWYMQAQVYKKKGEYAKAAEKLRKVTEEYPEDIRADNSLYELGELYETHLNDIEQAKTFYETLFIDYSGSTLAVEARKRYRILRGDDIQ